MCIRDRYYTFLLVKLKTQDVGKFLVFFFSLICNTLWIYNDATRRDEMKCVYTSFYFVLFVFKTLLAKRYLSVSNNRLINITISGFSLVCWLLDKYDESFCCWRLTSISNNFYSSFIHSLPVMIIIFFVISYYFFGVRALPGNKQK